ncbi:MAG: type I 3-dehydroquinate dehydratase [Lachnospiraceae bacterium]|nr:type I 3-dehydroquinate dehydratase [Lachnospiraceae bacterium]
MKKIKIRQMEIGDGIPKIALPIQSTAEDVLARIPGANADFLEFRADAFYEGNSEGVLAALHKLRERTDLPILFTFRTAAEGGPKAIGDIAYKELLAAAVDTKDPDFVDIELMRRTFDEALAYAHAKHVPVVASFHDFDGTPAESRMVRLMEEMESRGADVAKIAVMPGKLADVRDALTVQAKEKVDLDIPSLVISMGQMGVRSRLDAGIFGAAFTFGCMPGYASAPGQTDTIFLRKELERRREFGGHLFLTGFMGTGKSTVAKELARTMGVPMIEMDEEIERREGRTIKSIFDRDGEEAFRDIETDLLLSLAGHSRSIVSCGGGVVLREKNRAVMKCLGTVINLTATPETLYERLKDEADKRPVLRGHTSPEGIADLYERRRPSYEAAMDASVATDGRTVEEICRQIQNAESSVLQERTF